MKYFKGYLLIIGASLFWGVSATAAKFLFTRQIDTVTLVQMRMSFSFLLLLLICLIFKKDLLRIKLKDLYRFGLLGIIGGAGSNFTYYFTIKETNVATAILLQYTAPLLVLAYAAVTREEELKFSKILAGIISLAGCFLAVGGEHFSLSGISNIGLITGVASAFCWAFANIWLRRILRDYSVWTTLLYSFFFASLFWIFFNTPAQIAEAGYSSGTWMIFFGFAMISVLIPHSLYFSGIRYLTASRAIITGTSEPVIAIISAFFFLNELLTPIQTVGAVLVIMAIGILQLKQDSSQELQPSPEV